MICDIIHIFQAHNVRHSYTGEWVLQQGMRHIALLMNNIYIEQEDVGAFRRKAAISGTGTSLCTVHKPNFMVVQLNLT